MALPRRHENLRVVNWIDDLTFIGTITSYGETCACYGWRRPGDSKFKLYTISRGCITGIGRVDAKEIVMDVSQGWLRQEVDRAKYRAASVPLHARVVTI